MTYRELLQKTIKYAPRDEARLWLAHAANLNQTDLITKESDQIPPSIILKYLRYLFQRSLGYPAAYIIGTVGFFGRTFAVNRDTLIPRPASEALVEAALEILNQKDIDLVLEPATGSGALIISLELELRQSHKKKAFYAGDISKKALKIARTNAKKYASQIFFKKGDLLKPFTNILENTGKSSVLIMTNLPYLTAKECRERTIRFEPKLALYGGKDGLFLYKKLFLQIKKHADRPIFFLGEASPEQMLKIENLAKTILDEKISEFQIRKDGHGLERVFGFSVNI